MILLILFLSLCVLVVGFLIFDNDKVLKRLKKQKEYFKITLKYENDARSLSVKSKPFSD